MVLTVEMNVWVALLMVIATGAGMAGVGMTVMHDALHGASSKHPWLNKLLGGSMYLLGSDVFAWKIQHNVLHHTHTNVDMFDQDIESRGFATFLEWTNIDYNPPSKGKFIWVAPVRVLVKPPTDSVPPFRFKTVTDAAAGEMCWS